VVLLAGGVVEACVRVLIPGPLPVWCSKGIALGGNAVVHESLLPVWVLCCGR
jgi:hypothetical protein